MNILTIGVFDGVHRGHQAVLSHLNSQSIVVTFSNHPSGILKGASPFLLSSIRLKLAFLTECGIEKTIVIPFTRDLSEMSFVDFLKSFSFRHLILGVDAVFGKGGLGQADTLRVLGLQRGFTVQIIPKLSDAGQPISSSRIRSLIQNGKLNEAEKLLGRPYCFDYSPQSEFDPTIALPPDGSYTVWSHSALGIGMTQLVIENCVPRLNSDMMQLISFGPNLNPNIFKHLCQTSPAVL
jgi:hypothetical protein